MPSLLRSSARFARSGHAARRRIVPAPLIGFSIAAALLIAPAGASADTSSTLTVVGTSDVSDSGLMGNLIQPGFLAAYPQFAPMGDFKYIGTATGTAITNAETGVGGPSVLIVHAASLENQFVAGGFSYEPYGRAIFTNDFVLAGSPSDPAGVAANAPHNIAQAFADIAAANATDPTTAEFVSRAGSPGTTVAEHGVWALVGANSPPSNLLLCTVSVANGGGETPIATGQGVTANGQACPATVVPPPWYHVEALTQGPNVVFANACNGQTNLSAGHCYVFTDRGTFDYLSSGTDLNGGSTPVTIPNLQILTRNNSASAPGGVTELTNYFHAYVINPAAFTSQPNITPNVPAAEDFVNYLTSPGFQSQLKGYLGATNDPPFVADASPILSATGLPGVDSAGTAVGIKGNLTNAEPGFPALANEPITVSEIEGGVPVAVASGTTDTGGNYNIGFVPTSSGSYQVSSGLISQIEIASLTPPFGDLLQPAASTPIAMSVQGAVSITSATPASGGALVAGGVAPGGPHANASVTILARPEGSSVAFNPVGTAALTATQSSYAVLARLPAGKWQLEASFSDPGRVLAATSGTVNVTLTAPAVPILAASVSLKKVSVKKGAVAITGSVSPAPTATGAYLELLGRHTTKVKITAAGTSATGKLSRQAKLTIAKGTTRFTIHASLKRGYHWSLELKYVRPHHKTGVSKLRTISVH